MSNRFNRACRRVDVAIGILVDRGSSGWRILITRRPRQVVLGGYWELPGGKIHAGESPEHCVVREFQEEVGLTVKPTRALSKVEHTYEHGHVVLYPFVCQWTGGVIEHRAVADHRWVRADELDAFRFPPANRPLMTEIDRLFGTVADPEQG